jgi:hypothetical protein
VKVGVVVIPVDQQFLHDPEKGIKGDCFRASIASILELPIKEVPHFCADSEGWHERLQEWLAKQGLCYLEINNVRPNDFKMLDISNCYHTLVGPSPRFPDELHCVVGRNGEMVFDPHVDKRGLVGDPSKWLTGFIVSLCNKNQNSEV